jgi:hypothetical protein
MSSSPEIDGFDGTASVVVSGGTTPYSYIWNDGSNQSNSMAVYLNSGWYIVEITDANACQIVDSVFVDSNVGLTEINTLFTTIYPNPTSELLFFSSTADNAEILDLHGRSIKTFENTSKIDVKFLSTGTYMLRLTKKEAVSIHRFVKE